MDGPFDPEPGEAILAAGEDSWEAPDEVARDDEGSHLADLDPDKPIVVSLFAGSNGGAPTSAHVPRRAAR